jgi:GTP-binding protein SAR1
MDWLWDSCRGVLEWLGILNKKATLIIIGLDNAGKTTLLGLLATGTVRQHIPTPKFGKEEVLIGKLSAACFDLGGAELQRKFWDDYFPIVDGVVFVVDVADKSRIEEAKGELDKLREHEVAGKLPLLILGNKIDRAEAMSEEEVRFALGLPHADDESDHAHLEMCAIAHKMGFGDGLKWLADQI